MSIQGSRSDLEAIEIQLFLEGVYQHYGYNFKEYAPGSLKRRLWTAIRAEGLSTVSGLQEKVLHDPESMERLLLTLSVNVTSLFRDPEFFVALRQKVVPVLRTYPFIRVWHAGCSSGEEVYSMAILLHEEGLYGRCRIYATDMNEVVLRRAREGIFPLQVAEEYNHNYRKAGGVKALSDYYTSAYGNAIFKSLLKENIVFSQHNLAMDRSFNEFNVILCRNVLIYFNSTLQHRVHSLLYDSLALFGILGLGSKETLQFTPYEKRYEPLSGSNKLYRRVQ